MMLMTIAALSVVSCHRNQPSPKMTAEIENLTKLQIALLDCKLNYIQQSTDALSGNGLLPWEIEQQLTNYLNKADDVLKNTSLDSYDISSTEYNIVKDIQERIDQINVVLGNFTELEVTGKKKVWTYSDMLSGYNFSATIDKSSKKNVIIVDFDKDSKDNISNEIETALAIFHREYEREQSEPRTIFTDENGYIID